MSGPSVVLHPRFPRGVDEALARLGIDLVTPGEDRVVEALASDGILVTFVWDDAYLDGVRWVQSISAGHDQFPSDEFARRDVVLTTASGVHAVQVAEHAFALLLALTRGVGVSMRNTAERRWRPMMLEELTGRTLGVLGLGAIGEEIARRAAAWGLTVIGTKATPAGYAGTAERVYPPDRTADVFVEADIVISVLPGGAETEGLVTRSMLEDLGGWFVNVGRGSVVSESDVLAALDSGDLLGAGLDVFQTEPLPEDSALWTHPRVVMTPHTAGLSPRYGDRLAEIVRHNLDALAGAAAWRNRVV